MKCEAGYTYSILARLQWLAFLLLFSTSYFKLIIVVVNLVFGVLVVEHDKPRYVDLIKFPVWLATLQQL